MQKTTSLHALVTATLLLASGITLAADPAPAPANTPVNAAPVGNNYGGYYGPGPNIATVKQALSMRDDTPVALKGQIIQNLGDEKFLFKDATGTIRIEIDHDLWYGQHITAKDTVEIQGEVDRDWNKLEIDVKRLVKIQ